MMNEWIISASLLIAAVLAVRFLLRGRISLRLQYALWAVVLLRLLLPVQIFTSDFGTGSIARNMDITEPVRQVYVSANENRYEREYDAAYHQVIAQYEAASQSYDPVAVEKTAQDMAQQRLELDLTKLLYHIWFAGMVVMTAVIFSCNLHLSLQLRRRRYEFPAPDSLLPVYVTEAVPTPCIFGFFHPAIYLTPEAAQDEQVRKHVLAHELTHYRHWDHVWSVLRSLCLVLHWYNPLVWIAARVSRADAELACDEGALARLGESQRGDYGRTLIGLTCASPVGDLFVTATTMTGSAGSIRERIRLLMKRPRNTILTVIAVILMVTLIVGCTFAGAPETTAPTGSTDPTESTPPETTAPSEPTGHTPDNDMSYEGQELPIPDDPGDTNLAYAPPMEQAMAEYADRNPRELTEEELKEFRAAFNTLREDGSANPAACFLLPYYDDITEMDGREFLAYFPTDQEGTEEEFELLKAKYPEFFGSWTWDTMPIPIHRYDAKVIDAVVSRYANIRWAELDEGVHYLEETGCYYNYTSDFGLGGFYARGGFVYDGGAVVYSDFSALFFTETMGSYTIRAHLPAIVTSPPSSHTMIPAELSDEDAIAAVVDAFFVAYEENQYLYTDNDYDHLTILAADPERTVTCSGKSVPLSDFHGNIEYLHGKVAYWKHVRQDQGITRHGFSVSTRVNDIRYEGDTAVVQAGVGVTFTYTDSTAPSGTGVDYELLLIQVDGEWLIADVFERNDWFDAENKNDPNFDPDALIASVIP